MDLELLTDFSPSFSECSAIYERLINKLKVRRPYLLQHNPFVTLHTKKVFKFK